MENSDQISVIVPVYNIEQYVGKCLESILGQTYKHIEIIVINDGSQDDTGKICNSYANIDGRVKVIHQKNAGVANARKQGIKLAKGELIVFVDGDDWIEPDTLEQMYCKMHDEEVDIVAAGYIRELPKATTVVLNKLEGKKYNIYQNEFLENVIYTSGSSRIGLDPSLCTKLFRTDILKQCIECMHENIHYAEDMVLLWQYMVKVNTIYVLENAYYHYRQREDSCIHTCDEVYFTQINSVYCILKYLFEECGIYKKLKEPLGKWLFKEVMRGLNGKFDFGFTCSVPEYYFEEQFFDKGTRVVLYGAGRVGKGYYLQIQNTKCVELIAWVDKDYRNEELEKLGVVSINAINEDEYDYILLATIYENMAENIKEELVAHGFDEKKILWLQPKNYVN